MFVEHTEPVMEMEISDNNLDLAEIGPIIDLEKLKVVAEAIEAAKNKMHSSKNLDENKDVEESTLEESQMTIDDSDLDISMSIEDSEFGLEASEEVMFPPILQESSEDSVDELEHIREEIIMDNDKYEEEKKIRLKSEEVRKMQLESDQNSKIELNSDVEHNIEYNSEENSENEYKSDDDEIEHSAEEESLLEYNSDEESNLEPEFEETGLQDNKVRESGTDESDIEYKSKEESKITYDSQENDISEYESGEESNDLLQQSSSELEKIQLQILVDNIQAAEAAMNKPIEAAKETPKEENIDNSKELGKSSKKHEIYAWKESETLPQGWKLKKTRKMAFVRELLLSPEEYIFCSRREALKSLVENNAEAEEVEYMRISLKYEGWKDSANLPEDWKYRKTKFQTFFCTENGILFKSCGEALEQIKIEHPELTEPFRAIFEIQVNKDEERKGWEISDSVPMGWKVRKADGDKAKIFFLSPQGIQFSSKVRALQHLIKEKCDEEEIAMMRMAMNDKYKEDPTLPTGWIFKELISRNQTLVLTSFGDILDSFKKVMLYTQFLGIYSAEDVGNLQKFTRPHSSKTKMSMYTETDDPSVPARWKARFVLGKIVSFLDPQGNLFKTRTAALQHWVRKKADSALIDEIQRCLVHEGWNTSNELPSGWMFKKNGKNIFLSREGIVIREGKNAIVYIKRRISKNYSQTDLEIMKAFIHNKNNLAKGKNLLWEEDPTIPSGWKMRKSGVKSGSNLFLSPDGSKFKTRKVAYLHMISQKYSREEIEAMREKLSVEAWEENELLPEGWIFKIKEAYEELVFITPEGFSFRDSKYKVLEFVRTSSNYNESDAEGIEMFYEIEYSRRIAEKYEWIERDESVPEGWKYRFSGQSNEKIHFLSPEGRTFPTRIAAYKQMVSSKCSEKEIEEMRTKFKYEGWNDDELLPKGWIYKVQVNGRKWTIVLISKEGFELNDGQGMVMKYLSKTPEYSDDDVQRMDMFYEIQNNKQRKLKYEWLEDEEVIPFGWKFRVEGKKTRMFFLSPDGHEFSSRHSSLLHMIEYSYQDEEIEEMRNSLRADGWLTNDCLPSGWRLKNYNAEKTFLAQSGEIIQGFSAALASIRDSHDYDESHVINLQKMEGGGLSWLEDDDTVPYGWKVSSAIYKHKQAVIMSPDGVQFVSRVLAFQHMLKSNADELELEDMREKLLHEGWNESPSLPPGWKCNISNGTVNVLSKDGDLFETNPSMEAKDFMKNSAAYTEEDVDRLSSLFNQETILEDHNPSKEWITDASVPEGWKIKLKDGKNYGRMSFLSPNGISYRSRKVALQSLLGSGCSEEEVAPLRKNLIKEDWKESELLPTNWLYKIQIVAKHCWLLTDTGKEVRSKESAMDILKDSKHDGEKLEMFYEMISAHKQLTKYEWEEKNETVPTGWKIRTVEGNSGKSSLLSPSGNAYTSRKIALQSLINSGATRNDIDDMRSKLVHEGWKESELLPENWVYKLFSAASLFIITEDGKEVNSKENTLDHMKNANRAYSTEEFDKMKMFFDMIFAQKRIMKHGWKDDESVPTGWKINNKNTLLSPEGSSYPNRKMALKAMIKNGRADDDIDKMRAKMTYDGWKPSDMLPKKWLYKRFGTKTGIVTSEGEETDSKQSAVTEMKSYNYTKDDLERLDNFYEMVYAEGRLSSTAWQEDSETLPHGWKYRIVNKSGKSNFLCPEGLSFTSRKAGYQHMIEAKYDPVEMDDMRRMLVQESWQFHDLLPVDWMFKALQYGQGSRKIIHILTCEGTEMKDSRLMVTEFMKSVDKYDTEDVKKLNQFFESQGGKSHIKRERQEWLEGSLTLPQGWKFKKEDGFKEYFLSPDNIQFTSRYQSLKHMVSTMFYTEKQINEMRNFLGSEGWKKHPDLPLNWMFKENFPVSKTPVVLITPEGEVLESMKAGLDFIKTIYNEADVVRMRRFMGEHSRYYKYNIKQETIDEMDQNSTRESESLSDEELEFDESDTEEDKLTEEDNHKSDIVHNIPLLKQEVKSPPKAGHELSPYKSPLELLKTKSVSPKPILASVPTKSVLNNSELDILLAKGNFASSLANQIKSERKRSHQELDMEELETLLTDGHFTSDIVDQIMKKMNNPKSNINLNSIGMEESRKRKSEEWEGELRRFRRRFAF